MKKRVYPPGRHCSQDYASPTLVRMFRHAKELLASAPDDLLLVTRVRKLENRLAARLAFEDRQEARAAAAGLRGQVLPTKSRKARDREARAAATLPDHDLWAEIEMRSPPPLPPAG
jgi:hypothetical protein